MTADFRMASSWGSRVSGLSGTGFRFGMVHTAV